MTARYTLEPETALRLAKFSQQAFDTPSDIVERLMDHFEATTGQAAVEPSALFDGKSTIRVSRGKAQLAEHSRPTQTTIGGVRLDDREYNAWNLVLNRLLQLCLQSHPYEDVFHGLPVIHCQGKPTFTERRQVVEGLDIYRRNATAPDAVRAILMLSDRFGIPVTSHFRWGATSELFGREGELSMEEPEDLIRVVEKPLVGHRFTHTSVLNAWINGEQLDPGRMNWAGVYEAIMTTAWFHTGTDTLRAITGREIEDGKGRFGEKNYRYLESIGVCLRDATAKGVADTAKTLAEHFPMAIEIEFEWKAKGRYPDHRGMLNFRTELDQGIQRAQRYRKVVPMRASNG